MVISLKEIYFEFFKLGVQLLGGGYVIVPLMKKYLIDEKKWLTESELADFYALSQSIPGIIAANISIFAGYKLRGKSGASAAILGIITSPVIAILMIATILDKIINIPFIHSVFWGVGIAVIILIYLSVKEMWKFSMIDTMSWIIFITTFVLSFCFNISPAISIIAAVIIGTTYKFFTEKRAK